MVLRITEKSWKRALQKYLQSEDFFALENFIEKEYREKEIFPNKKNIFRAFEKTPLDRVKVVIIGQDPYHTPGIAEGLCFSVPEGAKIPPSIRNIYKEIKEDLDIEKDFSYANLKGWAEQGVLLLNRVLTVKAHKPGSHWKKGWENFTDEVVRKIAREKPGIIFILWGKNAQEVENIIFEENKRKKIEGRESEKSIILISAHPSPFSAYRGFFGNKHFSKTNQYLKKQGKKEIDW